MTECLLTDGTHDPAPPGHDLCERCENRMEQAKKGITTIVLDRCARCPQRATVVLVYDEDGRIECLCQEHADEEINK